MATENGIVIARIVKARGIKGEVSCDVETDFPERFNSLRSVTLKQRDGTSFQAEIEAAWFHKNRVVLKIAGYDSMTAAETLAGCLVVIPESEAAPLGQDEFHEFDIIGSAVATVLGESVGVVTRLMHAGGTELLVVEGADKREYLIPFVEEICIEVDSEARRIKIDPPEGLLDL
jgi:16S rRNA processing protein RimM